MSGSGDTTVNSIPDWARPYVEGYMQNAQGVAARPYQAYEGNRVAQMNPYETAGYNAQAQRAMQGSPVNAAASDEITRTLQGGYLDSNPYLNAMIDRASGDVNRNYDQVAARSGSFGNAGVEQARLQALSQSANDIRYQNYAAERNRMQGALGMAPTIANQDYVDADRLTGAGAAFRGAEQANLNDAYGRFTEARDYPEHQLDILSRAAGMNTGNTSTTDYGQNYWNTALGAAASYYGGAYGRNGGGK